MVWGLQNQLSNYSIYNIDIYIELESVRNFSILLWRSHLKKYLTYIISQGYGFYTITKKLLNAFTFPISDILFFLNAAWFPAYTMKPVYVKITEPARKNQVQLKKISLP